MGVRSKLVILTMGLAFVVGLGPIAYSVQEHRRALFGEVEQRGVVIAKMLSHRLGELGARLDTINDWAPLHAIRGEPDVRSAHTLDTGGVVVNDGTRRSGTRGGERLPSFDAVADQVRESGGFVTRRDGSLLHVSGPVRAGEEIEGYVHVILSFDRAEAQVADMLQTQATILGAMCLAAAGVAFLLSHILRRPIQLVLDGVDAIRQGNYKVELPVRSRDELGRLAGSINEVAAHLRATTLSKRYLDEVLQSMVDSLIVVDTEANIVTVNRATLEMLGYAEPKLIGQPASLICIDEGYQLTGARLDHLLGERAQHDHELMYRTSDGGLIPISFSGSPIRDNSGEVVGYVCIGKDITERKRAESDRERLNQKLVDTSRQAGMAEVATGVLHNVGNVLNSVNISASLVVETVKKSKITGLAKATELIRQHEADLHAFLTGDEKGRQLPSYLCQLAERLTGEQMTILGELDSLTNNINHIKEIIGMQQSYSRVAGVLESVNLAEVVDEALRLNAVSLERHKMELKRLVEYVPPVKTDRHKVLQVLVNLVTNAKDAMASGEGQHLLTVRLRKDPENDKVVQIQIADNGHGIPPEIMTRIFTHGFTTKHNGHGFGLHSAALTAKELGGALVARSDGPGKGAVFTLSLPLAVAEVRK